jgi:hypothetical protein
MLLLCCFDYSTLLSKMYGLVLLLYSLTAAVSAQGNAVTTTSNIHSIVTAVTTGEYGLDPWELGFGTTGSGMVCAIYIYIYIASLNGVRKVIAIHITRPQYATHNSFSSCSLFSLSISGITHSVCHLAFMYAMWLGRLCE